MIIADGKEMGEEIFGGRADMRALRAAAELHISYAAKVTC